MGESDVRDMRDMFADLFRWMLQRLAAKSTPETMLLVIDDFHFVDEASLSVLEVRVGYENEFFCNSEWGFERK